AELARQIAGMTTPPAAILAEADAVMEALAKYLPKDLRGMLGDDPATQAAIRDALLQEGAAEVLAHLHGLEDDA
ncbi:MAG: DNA repair exonuclease, partial [Paracoccaceae bacterium]|nr:DNA repair exonuclease [Paracoccaceae bacterium]